MSYPYNEPKETISPNKIRRQALQNAQSCICNIVALEDLNLDPEGCGFTIGIDGYGDLSADGSTTSMPEGPSLAVAAELQNAVKRIKAILKEAAEGYLAIGLNDGQEG